MMGVLHDRVAIITGGGRGIGREIARLFARQGALVAVATRSEPSGRQVVDEICAAGGQAALFLVDAADRAQMRAMIAKVAAHFGRIDIIVHNAAQIGSAPLHEMPDNHLDAILNTNLKAAFWLAKDAFPQLAASDGARLLFVSSIVGNSITSRHLAAYGVSKAALNGFIRQAGAELAGFGIRVNGVEPGITLTEHVTLHLGEHLDAINQSIPLGRATEPLHVAEALLFLASPAASHITGQTIVIDGGQSLGYRG